MRKNLTKNITCGERWDYTSKHRAGGYCSSRLVAVERSGWHLDWPVRPRVE